MNPAELLAAADQARQQAHAPYSHYRVGAAVLAPDGSITTGCNVENASYGLTICAERVAIASAVAEGKTQFTALAIVAGEGATPFPCGACRQVLSEFCTSDFPIHIAQSGHLDAYETTTLGTLLPNAFGL